MFDDSDKKYPDHGYVTGSSTVGFEMAIPLLSPMAKRVAFGGLVEAITGEGINVVGVVGNIVIPGDDMAVRLATRRAPVPQQALLDYQSNVTAVEVKAYTVGYYHAEAGQKPIYAGYPKRPPFPLEKCVPMEPERAAELLDNPRYISTMFSVTRPSVPIPFMIASHLLWLSDNGLTELMLKVTQKVGVHFKNDGDTMSLISNILGVNLG